MRPPRVKRPGPTVPSRPFTDWLAERYTQYDSEETSRAYSRPAVRLAQDIGWCKPGDERRVVDNALRKLYRYRNGVTETKRDGEYVTLPVVEFNRAIVEAACDHVSQTLFAELYPHLAAEDDLDFGADMILEPDAWCPYCQQHVTPIDGLCPWCQCEHGHLFREVGITEDGFACLACAKKERAERRALKKAA